jgi:putative transcription antitermination factor YqgF
MKILALDLGLKRTGIAFLDTENGVPLSLDTLHHDSAEEVVEAVTRIAHVKGVTHVVMGLPLLPSGDEGEQASVTRACGELLAEKGLTVSYLDERYTTPKNVAHGDAVAACELLNLAQKLGIDKL